MPHMKYLRDTEHGQIIADCEQKKKILKNINIKIHMCNHFHSSLSSSKDSLLVKTVKLSFCQGPQHFSQDNPVRSQVSHGAILRPLAHFFVASIHY